MRKLPFVTAGALALIALVSTEYKGGAPRQGALGIAVWLVIAGSIAVAASQARRRPGLWGWVTGACAVSGAALLGLALGSRRYDPLTAISTLGVVVLCGATAIAGGRQSWRRSPMSAAGMSQLFAVGGALMVVGLIVPGSYGGSVGFGDWNMTDRIGLETVGRVIELAVFGVGVVLGAVLRTQWGRWLAAGAGAPVVLNVLVNQASREGASFYLFERADPSVLLVLASLAFCGLAVATFATADEDVFDEDPSPAPATTSGPSIAGSDGSPHLVVGPPAVFASFGARLGAFVVDSLINAAFVVPAYALAYGGALAGEGGMAAAGLAMALVGSVVYPVIYCVQVGRRGQSWGHRAAGVRVVDAATGAPIGGGRAFGRLILRALSAMPCYLGLLWALWDKNRRGWHDLGVGSVVVPASVPWANGSGVHPIGRPDSLVAAPLRRPPPPGPGAVLSPPPAAWSLQPPVLAPPLLRVAQPELPRPVAPFTSGSEPAAPPPVRVRWAPSTPPPDTTVVRRGPFDPSGAITLRFDDGSRLALDRVVLIGRDPALAAGDLGALLVSLHDPRMSVSKTHLAMGVDGHGAWVEDRHSTNGATVHHSHGERVRVVVGRRARVPAGARVEFGDRWVEVASG